MVHIHWRSTLAGSILFLLAALLASCASVRTHGAEPATPTRSAAPSQQVVVYAGIANSLRVYDLDTKTGDLQVRQTVADLKGDVQYVAVHPTRKWLYVSCTETAPPKVSTIYAFSIDETTGSLTLLGAPYTPPLSRAIHISVDNTGHYLLLAHNVTESVSALSLNADGTLGEPVKQPEETHHLGFLVHQIRIDPSNKWVIVPVRGDDEKVTIAGKDKKVEPEKFGHIVVFEFDDGVLAKRRTIDFPTLLGPRHIDFHPSKPLIYVSMERGNRILTYKHESGILTELFSTTTLQDPSLKFPAQRAGPIQVHPNGKWVYVANRNTQSCPPGTPCDKPVAAGENDIAVFSLDLATGEPTLIENVDTHGFEARTMTIDPTLHFLIVANQKEFSGRDRRDPEKTLKAGPNLSVYRIGDDGRLSHVRTNDVAGGEIWWVGAVARP
jgi:6-phosphogluconolactonase